MQRGSSLAENKRFPQPPLPFKNSFRALVAGDSMGNAVAGVYAAWRKLNLHIQLLKSA